MTRPLHLSATAHKEYLHCPNCFFLSYICGLRPAVEADPFRMGTNYHKLQELYRTAIRGGTEPDASFDLAIANLNEAYKDCPPSVSLADWAEERASVAAMFAGHRWRYQNEKVEVVASEIPFELPLFHPKTGLPLPKTDVIRRGKIDELLRIDGLLYISDYKTTSKPINAESEFWSHLRLDPQISTYVGAARDMLRLGLLEEYGVGKDEVIAGAWYDVVHKPSISPKKLSQADTTAFIESGEYHGQKFAVVLNEGAVSVDGVSAEVEVMKKGFAIRETSEMYQARLLADICARPDFYFARRPIPRTDNEIADFQREQYSIYQVIKFQRDKGFWFRNGTHDSMGMHGQMSPLCYHNFDPSTGEVPAGYKKVF